MAGRKLTKKTDPGPPKNPKIGRYWYDSMTGTLRRWNGKDWTTEAKPGEYQTINRKGENYE